MAGGWVGSTRRQRLPRDWTAIRQRILDRDGHQCTRLVDGQRCANRATDVDHITAGDNHADHNLTSLCPPHHRQKSGHEGGTAAARNRNVRRPPERHPGLT